MIDIVVTYLNSKDEKWNEEYDYYRDIEVEKGIQKVMR